MKFIKHVQMIIFYGWNYNFTNFTVVANCNEPLTEDNNNEN